MTTFEPLPEKQILSYQVRGPEIEALMGIFLQQPVIALDTLITKFVPTESPNQSLKTDLLREALNFLRTVEFIQQSTNESQMPVFHLAQGFSAEEPFILHLLRRLHSLDDDRRAFRLIWDLAAHQNLLLAHRREVVTRLEQAYSGSYSWNEEKFRTWQNLTNYLGLVRGIKPDQGDTMFCPQPRLLLMLFEAFGVKQSQKVKQVPISEWLEFVHETYFSCFTERKDVHLGLARSLNAMHILGQLTFDMRSDVPGATYLENQRVGYLVLTA